MSVEWQDFQNSDNSSLSWHLPSSLDRHCTKLPQSSSLSLVPLLLLLHSNLDWYFIGIGDWMSVILCCNRREWQMPLYCFKFDLQQILCADNDGAVHRSGRASQCGGSAATSREGDRKLHCLWGCRHHLPGHSLGAEESQKVGYFWEANKARQQFCSIIRSFTFI